MRVASERQRPCRAKLLRNIIARSTLDLISLYFTVINPYTTSTYKQQVRTVDPKVEGSSPFGNGPHGKD
jgi:hypothetical protein